MQNFFPNQTPEDLRPRGAFHCEAVSRPMPCPCGLAADARFTAANPLILLMSRALIAACSAARSRSRNKLLASAPRCFLAPAEPSGTVQAQLRREEARHEDRGRKHQRHGRLGAGARPSPQTMSMAPSRPSPTMPPDQPAAPGSPAPAPSPHKDFLVAMRARLHRGSHGKPRFPASATDTAGCGRGSGRDLRTLEYFLLNIIYNTTNL